MEAHFRPSKRRILAGRILGAVVILFLALDGGMKLVKPRVVVETMAQLGYSESTIAGIGIVLLLCTGLYAIPRTALLGAILLTGYLGGAVASNVRAATPLFNILFPVLCGAGLWAALMLRDARVPAALFGRNSR